MAGKVRYSGFRIETFPRGLWRLDGHGPIALDANPSTKTPRIEVQLTPLNIPARAHPRLRLDGNSYTPSGRIIVKTSIGTIPALRTGSFWVDGRPDPWSGYRRLELPIDVQKTTLRIRHIGDYPATAALFHPSFHEVRLLEFAAVTHPTIKRVVIPCLELFRRYYGTSSRLSKLIFTGNFTSGQKRLYDPDRSFPIGDDGYYLQLGEYLGNNDRFTVARIAADKVANQNVELIVSKTIAASNFSQPYYLYSQPPFHGPTVLHVCGHLMPAPDYDAFFVYWIAFCSGPRPFSWLEWNRDNDNRQSRVEDPERLKWT